MEQTKSASQEELLLLLKTDPPTAMAQIMKQYTPYVWNTVRLHLTDPEDIKECVNDTFWAFYCRHAQFDTRKGSLPAFLRGIARKQAISRYREIRRRDAAEQAAGGPAFVEETPRLIDRLDLESALASLDPQDAEIIRMKYFMGMTVDEIARDVGLSYEAAKKRHQRILGKIRLLLITVTAVLLLVTLAACSYFLLRHMGVIPGYRVSETSEALPYTLAVEAAAQTPSGSCTLWAAFFEYGNLVLCLRLQVPEDLLPALGDSLSSITLAYGGESYPCGSDYGVSPDNPTDIELSLSCYELSPPPEDADTLSMTLWFGETPLPFTLQRARRDNPERFRYSLGALGGLLAIPALKDGGLEVELYPLNTADGYAIEPRLLWDTRMGGKSGEITLVRSDGAVFPGRYSYDPTARFFSRWSFEVSEPGSYSLRVPYLYLTVSPEEPLRIPIDLESCQWSDSVFRIPHGTLSVVSCRPLDIPAGEPIPGSPNTAAEGCSYWAVKLRHLTDREDMEITAVYPGASRATAAAGEIRPGETPPPWNLSVGSLTLEPEEGCTELLLTAWDGACDLSSFELELDRVSLRWTHTFDISLTVE